MATDNSDNGTGSGGESPFESAKKAFGDTAASFTDQASAKARDYTSQGKDRAVEALDNVVGLVSDAAAQVSDRLGEQYGGYIKQAADAVGGLADTLREKDPDELFDDARNAVRSSPAIAIAAAAAVGFLLARVVKSGLTPSASNDAPATPAGSTTPSAKPAPKPRAARKPAASKAVSPEAPFADTPISTTPSPDSSTPVA